MNRRSFLSSLLALPIVNRFFPAPIYTTLAPPRYDYTEAERTIKVSSEPAAFQDKYFSVSMDFTHEEIERSLEDFRNREIR